jgi:hypothetical protein
MQSKNTHQHPVTLRATLIGLACVVMFCFVVPYNDFFIEGTFLAGNHFPIGAMFLLLFFLLCLNPTLKSIRKSWGLRESELATIWCMMIVSIGIPTVGLARWLFPILVGFRYFATAENDWNTLFKHYFPDWLAPAETYAVQFFYEKLPDGEPIPYLAWIKPLLFWMGVIGGLWLMMIALSALFRRQWIERERYIFPLAQLPMEMVSDPAGSRHLNSFMRNRLLWLSVSIPVLIHTVNGLHSYVPTFPGFPLQLRLDPMLTEKPWSAARPLWLYVFPSMVGFTYLIRLDVAFSIWVFFLIYKAQLVIGTAFGLSMRQSMGYSSRAFASHLEMGGYIAAVVLFFWVGRRHFREMFMAAFFRRPYNGAESEPLPPLWTFLFLLIGVLVPTSLLHAAGVSLALSIGVIVLMGISSIMLTWLVIAGGLLHINSSFRAFDFYETALGSGRIGQVNLAVLVIPASIFRTKRGFLMPHIANSFKLSDGLRINGRQLLAVMGLALLLAVALTCYLFLRLVYQTGALNMQYWTFVTAPQTPFRWLETQFQAPSETDWANLGFVGLGAVVMSALFILRQRLFWWPLHPIGFVASPGEWPMMNLWFSIFLGWLGKVIVLKYGGLKTYQQAKPFFLGLVLGDCFIGGIWAIIGMIVGDGYAMLPG